MASSFPVGRIEGIFVRELDGELVVYDLETNAVHCLNETAAVVWRHSDGATSIPDLAAAASAELGNEVDEEIVLAALDHLRNASLLDDEEPAAGLSRAGLLRRSAVAAAVAVPLVTTVVAPAFAGTASCVAEGDPCDLGVPCCPGLTCSPQIPIVCVHD